MLVLSRKKNESIVINDNIAIVVIEIRGDKVRLGIEAPKEVSVHRREVYDAIRRDEQELGGHKELGKSREYMDSRIHNLCPNLDYSYQDNDIHDKLTPYNF